MDFSGLASRSVHYVVQASTLQLFCRVHVHLLTVLDDDALYVKGDPLPLPATRAIALSLNALVFHSHVSTGLSGQAQVSTGAARHGGNEVALAAAEACLQGLYGRNARREFAPVSAWLAPWQAAERADARLRSNTVDGKKPDRSGDKKSDGGKSALMATALRVLLSRSARETPDDESAGDESTGGDESAATRAAMSQTMSQQGAGGVGGLSLAELQGPAAAVADLLQVRQYVVLCARITLLRQQHVPFHVAPHPCSCNNASMLTARLQHELCAAQAAPWAVPYAQRVELFRELLALDKRERGYAEARPGANAARAIKIQVPAQHTLKLFTHSHLLS